MEATHALIGSALTLGSGLGAFSALVGFTWLSTHRKSLAWLRCLAQRSHLMRHLVLKRSRLGWSLAQMFCDAKAQKEAYVFRACGISSLQGREDLLQRSASIDVRSIEMSGQNARALIGYETWHPKLR